MFLLGVDFLSRCDNSYHDMIIVWLQYYSEILPISNLKSFLWLFLYFKVLLQNMCNWANKSIQIFKVLKQTFFILAVCIFQFILYCKLFAWMNIIVPYLTSKLNNFSSKLQFLGYLRWWIEPKNDFSRISSKYQ